MHSSIVASILGLVASTSAHMKMSEPKGWFVNNSPLEADGSDFPCKAVNYGAQSEINTYQQGQSAPLTFIGQAVHGGGSCQVVLTTDASPTKSSKWKVIKSIIGGCPAQGEAGNMGDNAEAEDPYKYEFVIPKEIPAGKYTIAWTWFNKIGNREMYMNCGPAEITGDGGDQSFYDSLPDMFVANIGGHDCHVIDGKDVVFPNPGQFVQSLGAATAADATATPFGPQCGAAGAAPAATPTPEPASSGSSAGSEDSDSSGSGGDDSLPGGVFVTTGTGASATGAADSADGGPAPAPTSDATLPGPDTPAGDDSSAPASESDPASAPAPAPAPAAPVPSADSGSSSGSDGAPGSTFAAGTACTQEGFWNCIGGSSYQRCASGAWSPPMALAAGTSCSGGLSENIALSRRGKPVQLGARMRL